MSEELLIKAIKNNEIGNLYLFYGQEEYLKRNYAEYIENTLLTEDFKLLNKVVLEGKVTVNTIIDNCETLPVFSDRKLVIVKNSSLFKGRKGSGEKAEASSREDMLANFLQNVPKHVCLIFIENEIDKRVKYINIIKKHGLIVELNGREPDKLIKWVIARVKTLNYEMDINTAEKLIDYCDQDMDNLMNEIKKLCSYAGDRKKIVFSDIEKVCTKSVKSRVFDLTDALAAKKPEKAMELLNDMVVLKEPMPKIMYMIARHIRQLLQVKLLVQNGSTQAEIASILKLTPYISGKIIKQTNSFSVEKLKSAVARGLELDIAVKTGELKDRTAVELMIAELSV